jgi:death-on-curing protein
MASKLAALIESVSGNHGFFDGNKRTAAILALVLIDRSGYRLVLPPGEDLDNAVLENLVLDLVCHRLDFDDVAAWFKARLKKA